MTEYVFYPIKIEETRLKISDHNINKQSLLKYMLTAYNAKKMAQVFNTLINDKVIKIVEDEYEVESIVSHDFEIQSYLVKWKNWHPEFCTWEPVSNLTNCQEHINQYLINLRIDKRLNQPSDFSNTRDEVAESILQVVEENNINADIVKDMFKRFKPVTNNQDEDFQNFLKRKMKGHSRNVKEEQVKALELWEQQINMFYPLFNVTVENVVDGEGPPADFEMITDYVSKVVNVNIEPVYGCCCKNTCADMKYQCWKIHTDRCPYTKTGLVNIPERNAIFECNSKCECDINCPYRVVQRGVKHEFKVFRTKNRGWGLKTKKLIKKGTFIIEYLGEIIKVDEAERRGQNYDQQNLTYLFDLDFAQKDPEYTIDAYKSGNLAHFINHSCDPNMSSRCVYINNLDIQLPRIAFFAARTIKPNEELTFDYQMTGIINDESVMSNEKVTNLVNRDVNNNIQNSENESNSTFSFNNVSLSKTNIESTENSSITTPIDIPRTKCLCNSKNCRIYLF